MDDETHLVQFQVYKAGLVRICIHLWAARDGEFELSNPVIICIFNQDQLKRLIARYEETAKEREKVLINVNIVSFTTSNHAGHSATQAIVMCLHALLFT